MVGSISNLMLGSMFQFHSNFERAFCKQTAVSDLVCLCPIKKTLDVHVYGLSFKKFIDKRQVGIKFPITLVSSMCCDEIRYE